MRKKLLMSIATLVTVMAVGIGATYALFTSNTVTVANNTVTSGSAEISVCNASGANTWNSSITPSLTLSGLVPGGEGQELSESAEIYLGNDDGTLNEKPGTDLCTSGSDGTSSVDLDMVPAVTNVVCDADLDPTQVELQFVVGGNDSGFKNLTEWDGNTDAVLPTFSPGDTNGVEIWAQLADTATAQNTSCTFDITFFGDQPETEEGGEGED